MNSYSSGSDRFIVMERFAASESSKTATSWWSSKYFFSQSRNSWRLAIEFGFFGVFQIIRKKASLYRLVSQKVLFQLHFFYQGLLIPWERNHFRAIFFFVKICFHFVCISRCVTHGRPRSSCLNIITRQRFHFQSWNASFCKRSKRSFMPYNWFHQKRFLATKVGRYFHIKKRRGK